MIYITYLLCAVGLFVVVTALYRMLSRGLSRSAKGQQLTRFGIASLLAVMPYAIAGRVGWNVSLTLLAVVSVVWMLTYPVLDFAANRRKRAEIDNRMDFAFGLYLFGFLSGGYIGFAALLPAWGAIISTALAAVEVPLMILAAFQVAYYMIYRASIDHDGLKLVLDTDANEVLEFIRSFPVWAVITGLVGVILFLMAWFYWNITGTPAVDHLNWAQRIGEVAYCVGMGWLMFRGGHCAFRRSGLPRLYIEDKAHAHECAGYADACRTRREVMKLSSPLMAMQSAGAQGRTYILVIGESASRDYMEAFTPSDANRGTTPWLARMARQGGAILFPNAYSCHFQTVPTLTRALTAMNQYNNGAFNTSVSVVDVANRLGMKVYWFSNQGHIGANDTAVTLIAETADRAAWTSQTLSRTSYDGELPAFLEQVDVAADKLIVFHLIGSHFTYANRYPAGEEHFKPDGDGGYLPSYRNSLRYTDTVLQQIYDYASCRLNLQAMVYCSDHADLPDRRRSPVFDGFGKLRIPLAVFPGKDYVATHPGVVEALRANAGRPFSNDLLFNLLCGLWEVESGDTPPELNIASPDYSLTPATTRVLLGEATVSDDPGYTGP